MDVAGSTQVAAAARGVELAVPAFVGREREMELVTAALANPPSVVFVEGEAGIGKSRLVRECLAAAKARTGQVLLAVCPPLREPFPLGPVVDGFRRLRPGVSGAGLSPLAGALRPLFPEWAADLPPVLEPMADAGAARHRLFRALLELIERLSVAVVVVEDAHWADTATLEWLLVLATAGNEGLSVVVTDRPGDVPESSLLPQIASRLSAGRVTQRITLGGLDVAQTRRLVGSMVAGGDVSERFAVFLHQRTDGVPLAVQESMLLLRDRHDIVRRGGELTRRVIEELNVPPTVRDMVLERAARLPGPAREVLNAAAVLAEPADEPLLVEVAGLDKEAAGVGIAAALASRLLVETEPGQLAFRHALDAEAVAEAIPAPRRHRLHAHAGAALERRDHPPVPRLCRHWRAAGDVARWDHYADAAAGLAVESGNHYTAAALLLELLTTVEHPPERLARLARRLGEATVYRGAAFGGLEAAVRDRLREILAGPDLPHTERGEIRLLLGWLLYQLGEFEAGQVEFETAVAELDDRPASATRAMLFLAAPEAPRDWPATRHLEWLERATRLLPRLRSAADRRMILIERAVALTQLGEESGWRAAAEIGQTAPTLAERQQLARGLLNLAQQGIGWGRYQDARERLDVAQVLAQDSGMERALDFVRFDRLLLDWYTGAWDGLAETLTELGEDEAMHPLVRLELDALVASLHLAHGRDPAKRLRRVHAEAVDLTYVDPAITLAAVGLARLSLGEGLPGEALQVTAPVADAVATKGIWTWGVDIAPVHVDALAECGQLRWATELTGQLAAWTQGRSVPAVEAAAMTCQSILMQAHNDMETSARCFADAAAAWAGLPRPYNELLAVERRGRCLLAAGKRDEGLDVLSDAQQRLRALGARWDADRVARVLRGHGVKVANAWRGGRRGYGSHLSPREREVVTLMARGLTNRQIGEALFLSPRTVDRHLSAAMRKLGASSRAALAVAAADSGLLSVDPDQPMP